MKETVYVINNIKEDGKVAVVRQLEAPYSVVESWFVGWGLAIKCLVVTAAFWGILLGIFSGDLVGIIAGVVAAVFGPIMFATWAYELKLGKAYIEDYSEGEPLSDEEIENELNEFFLEEKEQKDER